MIHFLSWSLGQATFSGALTRSSAADGLPDRITLSRSEYGSVVLEDGPLVMFRMDSASSGYTGGYVNSGTLGTLTSATGSGVKISPGGTVQWTSASTIAMPWQLSTIPRKLIYTGGAGTFFTVTPYTTGTGSSTFQFDQTKPFSAEIWTTLPTTNAAIFANSAANPPTGGGFALRGNSGRYGGSSLTINNFASASVGGFEDDYLSFFAGYTSTVLRHVCVVYTPDSNGKVRSISGSGNTPQSAQYITGGYVVYVDGKRCEYASSFTGNPTTGYTRAMPDQAWYIGVSAGSYWGFNVAHNSHFALYDKALTAEQVWRRVRPFGTGSAYFSASFTSSVVLSGVMVPGVSPSAVEPITLPAPSGTVPYYAQAGSGTHTVSVSIDGGAYVQVVANAPLSMSLSSSLIVRVDMGMRYGIDSLPYIQAPSVVYDDMTVISAGSIGGKTNRKLN